MANIRKMQRRSGRGRGISSGDSAARTRPRAWGVTSGPAPGARSIAVVRIESRPKPRLRMAAVSSTPPQVVAYLLFPGNDFLAERELGFSRSLAFGCGSLGAQDAGAVFRFLPLLAANLT